jgi:hypothetical protein
VPLSFFWSAFAFFLSQNKIIRFFRFNAVTFHKFLLPLICCLRSKDLVVAHAPLGSVQVVSFVNPSCLSALESEKFSIRGIFFVAKLSYIDDKIQR